MNKTQYIATLVAALLLCSAFAEDTDCGALITTSTIEGTAKVENLTGANAGKATITINNNSGTANSVTVYNSATMDTALSGKASTGDVTALQTRATALETATNNLTTAVAAAQSTADGALQKTGGTMTGDLIVEGATFRWMYGQDFIVPTVGPQGIGLMYRYGGTDYYLMFPGSPNDTAALKSDIPTSFSYTAITNAPWLLSSAISSWALASTKPSYNFSEIGNKPTTISGYGITDAKIDNGTITLGSNSITPLTSFTESDPIWTAAKSSYSTTTQMNTAIASATNGLATVAKTGAYSDLTGKPTTMKNPSALSIVSTTTTTYDGSATASVNQTTATLASTTQNGTTGKNLTVAVAATSIDMGAYYIKIGSDGKPHLMLRK